MNEVLNKAYSELKICDEYCAHCESEVIIPADKISYCPSCGMQILPCSMCDPYTTDCTKCKFKSHTGYKPHNVTLLAFLHTLSAIGEDVDLYVDGIGSVAYCCELLTGAGMEEYNECLTKCYVKKGYIIEWDSDETDDEMGIPQCAHEAYNMLLAMAGCCPVDIHCKLFYTND